MTDILALERDPCSVCYENSDTVLDCHSVCGGCLKKHFKQECPVCRKRHFLPISGTPPTYQHSKGVSTQPKKDTPLRSLAEIYAELRKKQKQEEIVPNVSTEDSDEDPDIFEENSDDAIDYDL